MKDKHKYVIPMLTTLVTITIYNLILIVMIVQRNKHMTKSSLTPTLLVYFSTFEFMHEYDGH